MVLGAQLRRLREQNGISRETAGKVIRGSLAKVGRLELGRVGFKERDVADLLTLYGVTDEHDRRIVLDLVRQCGRPGWWHQYDNVVPGWFEMYLGLEQASSGISSYEPQFVPGLLQTEAYARAVIGLGHPRGPSEEIERRVSLRMRRQDMLTAPGAPSLWAVIDEAALWRLVDRSMLRAQVQHLIDLAELPNVTLQALPLRAGGHAGAGPPFIILRFSEPELPGIVYLEQLNSAVYLDRRQDVHRYQSVVDRLCAQAESPARTTSFLIEFLQDA